MFNCMLYEIYMVEVMCGVVVMVVGDIGVVV